MTKDELADALDQILDFQQPHLEAEEVRDIREAAQLIRDMPEGERIEGYVALEDFEKAKKKCSNGLIFMLCFANFQAIESNSEEVSATLTIHKRKEAPQ